MAHKKFAKGFLIAFGRLPLVKFAKGQSANSDLKTINFQSNRF
ncbi:hypothetical protein ENHAE0001_2517 [Enhydrobacter aerosaccus SK60]|nr:hypothetical protein ENHAE0001_2517 [Enhydrobacter aerosaccus SK60]